MSTKMQFFEEINNFISEWDAIEASYLQQPEYEESECEDE